MLGKLQPLYVEFNIVWIIKEYLSKEYLSIYSEGCMKGKDSLRICESKFKFGRSTNATSSICKGYSSQLACKEKCQRENC